MNAMASVKSGRDYLGKIMYQGVLVDQKAFFTTKILYSYMNEM